MDHPKPTEKRVIKGQIHAGQYGHVGIIVDYFKGKKNGVFIEAGAWNGEDLSNTLKLEVEYGWSGLLGCK